MLFLYNILLLLFLILFWPVLLAIVYCTPKYRHYLPARFGFRLRQKVPAAADGVQTIWVHALSVGEVTSALPLVLGLRKQFPQKRLVFSASTRAGMGVAHKIIGPHVDHIVAFPVDLLPVVNRFFSVLRPDLFILVETDFWPNILRVAQSRNIPALLVNGRVSAQSMHSYHRFRLFFMPLFQSFQTLCMQTELDRSNMIRLGVPPHKVVTLGNLKFDTPLPATPPSTALPVSLPEHGALIVAGSTHDGEERLLLEAFAQLKKNHPTLYLVLGPRNINRGEEIEHLATDMGFSASRFSQDVPPGKDIFILDTIGELIHFYGVSDIAFVGGSLVAQGGHNPIEPAALSKPVLFGPHMEDFSEISQGLLQTDGARQVTAATVATTLQGLLEDENSRHAMGKAAHHYTQQQQGVVLHLVDICRNLL